jgi:hypothetical protein
MVVIEDKSECVRTVQASHCDVWCRVYGRQTLLRSRPWSNVDGVSRDVMGAACFTVVVVS